MPIRFASSLTHEVRTCGQAARARGIPVWLELKTLLLEGDDALFAVHLRGSDRLHNRRFKRLFALKNLVFASTRRLASFGLETGKINPWTVPDCARHVVDRAVMPLAWLATNDGTLTGTMVVMQADLIALPGVRFLKIGVEPHP